MKRDTRRMPLVADVRAFPVHIACDAASRSELAAPMMARDDVLGVEQIALLCRHRRSALIQAACLVAPQDMLR